MIVSILTFLESINKLLKLAISMANSILVQKCMYNELKVDCEFKEMGQKVILSRISTFICFLPDCLPLPLLSLVFLVSFIGLGNTFDHLLYRSSRILLILTMRSFRYFLYEWVTMCIHPFSYTRRAPCIG